MNCLIFHAFKFDTVKAFKFGKLLIWYWFSDILYWNPIDSVTLLDLKELLMHFICLSRASLAPSSSCSRFLTFPSRSCLSRALTSLSCAPSADFCLAFQIWYRQSIQIWKITDLIWIFGKLISKSNRLSDIMRLKRGTLYVEKQMNC